MSILLNIHHDCALWETCNGVPVVLQNAVNSAWNEFEAQGVEHGLCANNVILEVGMVLADNSFIQSLNDRYRGKNQPTNVLSFVNSEKSAISDVSIEENEELGDIIFAYETIAQEASTMGISLEDHLTHMAIHGFLHLLGYDHIESEEAEEMESLESKIILGMGLSDPYAAMTTP